MNDFGKKENLRSRLSDPGLIRDRAYIDGDWVDGGEGKVFPVRDPAVGDVIAEVADLGMRDAETAIAAAERAFNGWRRLTAKQRAAVLRAWHGLILANIDDLARIMTAEQGKPVAEAKGEIAFGAAYVEWYAEEAKRVYGDTIPEYATDRRILVLKQAIGVVGAITPWNYPSAMIVRKCAPALAAGCTVVLKPAEQTPLSALALAELADRAGFPKGVFNVVTASDPVPVGEAMTASAAVRKMTFTGSTEIGKLLMAQGAKTVKKVTLELGGSAPFIVFEDADLDAAVEGLMASKFRCSGQTCVCANRILVEDGVYDDFADRFAAAVRTLKVGNGFESGVDQGPLIDERAVEKVQRHVDDAVSRGARVIVGGKSHALGGMYYEPTVLTEVTDDMIVMREETFGPVAPLIRFKGEAEAIRIANDTDYGLAGYFYTRDLGRAWRMAEELEVGSVGVNTGVMSTEVAPAGGVKESGTGREGSKYGIDDFLELKYVCMAGIDR